MLVDTHAHIHFDQYRDELELMLERGKAAEVNQIITVGVDETDSAAAQKCAENNQDVYASVGLHPHEAKKGQAALKKLEALAGAEKVVAIGECGLDYYRNLSEPIDQERALRFQIELALKSDLPLIFHVRDAFEDFFRIIKDYPDAKGVVHSFSADSAAADKLVERGFLIGLNGIMTFTKDKAQLEAAKQIPPENVLLETDCPFLSPAPLRGRVNEPANIKVIAEFLAELRGESVKELAATTTTNAKRLFGLPSL